MTEPDEQSPAPAPVPANAVDAVGLALITPIGISDPGDPVDRIQAALRAAIDR
jgi:hypothetical protein